MIDETGVGGKKEGCAVCIVADVYRCAVGEEKAQSFQGGTG